MSDHSGGAITRRNFVNTGIGISAGAIIPSILPHIGKAETVSKEQTGKKMIGMQVGAVSFIDEGVNKVLDILQERGQVNTLFLATFTYGRGIAGRQMPGFPFPDHGKQEYDVDYHGGNFAKSHPQYYTKTVLKETRSPDHGDWDILEKVIPEARKRGLKIYAWNEDQWNWTLPNIQKLQEFNLNMELSPNVCDYNPEYRNFITGLTRDHCASYDLDGLMWGSERQGPLNNALLGSRVACFCSFHRKAALDRGIDVERAMEGFKKLVDFTTKAKAGQKPIDGYFVEFWRIMTDYPEIIAWEKLWTDGNRATHSDIFKAAKEARPQVHVGFHIMHAISFNPFFRAEKAYEQFAYADFLKPVIYNICGGSRYANYINNIGSTMFGDLSKEKVLEINNQFLNYGDMPSLSELPKQGLPADYVFRETKRALDSVKGKIKIYPGIEIDIPAVPENKQTKPEDVYSSTTAALKAGAHGIIFSRKYSEMYLANISGGGDAVKSFYLSAK